MTCPEGSESRRYVVIGGGAVGGALAAEFARAGREVLLVARGEHGRLIRERGLIVRRPTGEQTVHPRVVLQPNEVSLEPRDVLLLTVKTQDAEQAVATWAWLPVREAGRTVGRAADLPIVTFQNGLAAEDMALRRFANVYGATIAIAASHTKPGEIVSQSLPPCAAVIWLGRHPSGSDAEQNAITADLNGAGFVAHSVRDSQSQKATKLLGSVGNVLDLLSGPDDLRERALRLLRQEALTVLLAAGIRFPPGEALDYHGTNLEILPVPGHVSGRLSTWQSFVRGASSEVDFLNGEVVLRARRLGLAAPLNQRAQRLALDPRYIRARSLERLLDE